MDNSYTLITMTAGTSMAIWEQTGLIARELAYYREMSKRVGRLVFLSYGSSQEEEARLLHQYIPNAGVICLGEGWAHSIPYGSLIGGLVSQRLKQLPKGCKMVRSNQFLGSWVGRRIAKHFGVPFILRCGYLFTKHYERSRPEAKIRQRLFQSLEKHTSHRAHHVIVTYDGAKQYFVNHHHVPSERVTVLGNPIDTVLFSPNEGEPTKDVLAIGRLTHQKNLMALIEACHDRGLTLTLIGGGEDEAILRKQAAILGAKVDFLGKLSNAKIPEQMRSHRLYALPSHYEGNPKSLLEAMAAGMAVLASRIPEHQFLDSKDPRGLLCGTSVKEISEGLNRLIQDRELRRSLGKRAREFAIESHSMENIADREALIHKTLLSRPS